MKVAFLLTWMLCGLIVGLSAGLVAPRWLGLGVVRTVGLGMVGAVVGGCLCSLVQGSEGAAFVVSTEAWYSFGAAVLGAVFALYLYRTYYPRKEWWQSNGS